MTWFYVFSIDLTLNDTVLHHRDRFQVAFNAKVRLIVFVLPIALSSMKYCNTVHNYQRKCSVQNFRVTDIQQLFNHHSSYTTHHTPLIIHHSSYTTHHTPLIIHHSSYTTHHTLLIIHHSSYTTDHTPLIIHQSSYTAHTPALVSTAQAPGNSSSRCRFRGRCSTL